MRIKGIEHAAINTTDIQASVRFYGEVLGFRRLETVDFDGFSITYFAVPGDGGGRLELFDYGGKNPRPARGESEAGLRHLAFAVDGVDEAEAYLRGRGVPIALPATDLPSLGARVLLFLDPDGTTLELCEPLNANRPQGEEDS